MYASGMAVLDRSKIRAGQAGKDRNLARSTDTMVAKGANTPAVVVDPAEKDELPAPGEGQTWIQCPNGHMLLHTVNPKSRHSTQYAVGQIACLECKKIANHPAGSPLCRRKCCYPKWEIFITAAQKKANKERLMKGFFGTNPPKRQKT